MTAEPNGRIGSTFDEFLKDEGIFEEVQAGALKRVAMGRPGEATKADKFSPGSRTIANRQQISD